MYSNGKIIYFKNEGDKKEKDKLTIGQNSNIRKNGPKELTFFCESQKKNIVLIQPENGKKSIDFLKEKAKGNCYDIDTWFK